MGSATEGLKSALATSYKASFGYRAELAKGVVMGENLLPIKILGQPEGNLVYMKSTMDQAILLQLLTARNRKRIKLFVLQEEGTNFIGDLLSLQSAAVPFKATIGVSRWAFGKRTAVYILSDSKAQLIVNPVPHLVRNGTERIWVFHLTLPSALLVEGDGGFSKMKRIK